MQSERSSYRSLSNIFNPQARGWKGRLPHAEARSHLVANLFFSDTLLVPAVSLLCNPLTHTFVKTDPSFLHALLCRKQIIPVFAGPTSSFEDLYERLGQKHSPALAVASSEDIEGAMRFLDAYLASGEIAPVRINEVDLHSTTTTISNKLLDDLPSTFPAISSARNRLADLFAREYDKTGWVSARWWYHLGKKTPDFALHDALLSGIGNLVYDFSYARLADSALSGHGYTQDTLTIARCSQTIFPSCELRVDPSFIDETDIDAHFFAQNVLVSVDGQRFEVLQKATVKSRNDYLEVMAKLSQFPTEENLLDAKEKLAQYLVALGSELKSTDLSEFAHEASRAKRMKLVCQVLSVGGKSVAIFTTGAVAERANKGSWIDMGIIACVGGLAAGAMTRAERRQKERLERQLKHLESVQPVHILVNRAGEPIRPDKRTEYRTNV